MIPLHLLLSNLAAENLIPPPLHDSDSRQLQVQGNSPGCDDPKWCSLFTKYFLLPSSTALTSTSRTRTDLGESSQDENDDLLFFVRDTCVKNGTAQRPQPTSKETVTKENFDGLHENKKDPVFVRRRLPGPNPMPSLDDKVHWMETFFLNLICQLPCKLTVAVCRRQPSNAGEEGKNLMVCSSNHISRRVYALPSRSRVVGDSARAKLGAGPGGTGWECSYPTIHYVVDDYEDIFEDVVLNEGEHLCVELSVTVTPPCKHNADNGMEENSGSLKPFPPFAPPGTKITLFQGAAPHSALHKTYMQKVGGGFARRFRMGRSPTEYVMMRGPGGKGNAQVAITATPTHIPESQVSCLEKNGGVSSKSSSPHPIPENSSSSPASSLTSSLPKLITSGTLFSTLKHLSLSAISGDHGSSDSESIRCCLTFVNVSWICIAK